MTGEEQSQPTFELKTNYAPNHIYTAAEAFETAQLNPEAIFVYLVVGDKSFNTHTDKGFDFPEIDVRVGEYQKIVSDKYQMIQFAGTIPVICEQSDHSGMKMAYLAVIPLASIGNTDTMYLADYYEDFELNPSNNKKLTDSLPIYGQSEDFQRQQTKSSVKAALLGNSYSGNYTAVVKQLDDAKIRSSVTVFDYNRIPLVNTKEKGLLRSQDNLIQADITRLPIAKDTKFNVMFGDFILSCFHPEKIEDFFTSVTDHLDEDGVLFLSLACNNQARNNGIVELPFAFDFTVRDLKNKILEQYFRATLSFYEQLAEQHGLTFKIIKEQIREEYPNVCDYYIAVIK